MSDLIIEADVWEYIFRKKKKMRNHETHNGYLPWSSIVIGDNYWNNRNSL